MISSSASLAADDLSIRCRVSHSKCAKQPDIDFGEAQEMTCTMRHWESSSRQTSPTNEDGGGGSSSGPSETLRAPAQMARRGSFRGADPVAAVSAFIEKAGGGGGGDCTRGRELLLCPIHLPQPPKGRTGPSSSGFPLHPGSLMGSMNSGMNGRGGMDGSNHSSSRSGMLSQRFHSFGSTPGVTSLPDHDVSGVGRGGMDAESDPGAAFSDSTIGGGRSPAPARLRGGGVRRDRVMSDGGLQGSVHSSGTSSVRSLSVGKKRPPSLPRLRPSAAAAFAVGGLGSTEKLDGSRHDLRALQSYQIALSDVIVVDVDGTSSSSSMRTNDFSAREDCRMNLTTVSHGYFEFVFQSKNAHDVLLAFLQASLPPERITHGRAAAIDGLECQGSTSQTDSDRLIQRNATGACCDGEAGGGSYDMEGFTAHEIKKSVKSEGLGDKIRRKFLHIAGQLQDISLSLTDCFCGAGTADLDDGPTASKVAMPVVAPATPRYHNKGDSVHTPIKQSPPALGTKFSLENTPLTAAAIDDRRNAPSEENASAGQFPHDLTPGPTPGRTERGGRPMPAVAPSGALSGHKAASAPLIPDILRKEYNTVGVGDGYDGPITPVGTSESEDDSKHEEGGGSASGARDKDEGKRDEYGHYDDGAKLQTVDI